MHAAETPVRPAGDKDSLAATGTHSRMIFYSVSGCYLSLAAAIIN
jgi:hypothetical protein